jgi:rSAM/selenodomain-associated transferase 2
VIVPTLNEARRIERLVQLVSRQLGPRDELLVVDGGSADGTPGLVEALDLDGVRVLAAERGRARQLNAGARAARGEWLLFLHADSLLHPEALDALRRSNGAAWGHFQVRIHDPSIVFRIAEVGMNHPAHTPTGDMGLFVRRAALDALGGVPDLPVLEDLVLAERLGASADPYRCPLVLLTSARRWRSQGVARTVLRMWWIRWAYHLGVSPSRLARFY